MNYDYNANLKFEERVDIISKEILNAYPSIGKECAIKIASIEMPIDTYDITDAKFKRLSNILFFCRNDEIIKNKVIEDILKSYKNLNIKNEKVDNYVNDIIIYKKYDTELPLYK